MISATSLSKKKRMRGSLENDSVTEVMDWATRKPAEHLPGLMSMALSYNAVGCIRALLLKDPSLAWRKRKRCKLYPLHRAVASNASSDTTEVRLEIISLLLAAGADMEVLDEEGHTPLKVLSKRTRPLHILTDYLNAERVKWRDECGRLLIDAGANTSVLKPNDPLVIYAEYRVVAMRQRLQARVALWKMLRERVPNLPRDVAKLILNAPELREAQSWSAWYVFAHKRARK